MEEEFFEGVPEISKGRKIALEIKDLLAGVAFPFIVMLVISTTILIYASFAEDLTVSIIALVGGEALFTVALVIFGRANGSAAYQKTVLYKQKRDLGSKDEKVLCRTGEYALWKGALIGFVICVPFLIFQIIELCFDNSVCNFCLQYMCGWAYYPFSYLGKRYQALNLIMIIMPVGVHTVGYHLGKLKQLKIQETIAENATKKGRRK